MVSAVSYLQYRLLVKNSYITLLFSDFIIIYFYDSDLVFLTQLEWLFIYYFIVIMILQVKIKSIFSQEELHPSYAETSVMIRGFPIWAVFHMWLILTKILG